MSRSSIFIADMYSAMPQKIDLANVGSTDQYNLLLHILRTPVFFSKERKLKYDLLRSCKSKSRYKIFKLQFKNNQKFSDGSPINAKHFFDLILWQIKSKSSIHFDFTSISKIILNSDYEIDIVLKNSNPNFLSQMVHPEFGLVKNIKDNMYLKDFKISSGPYSILECNEKKILLSKNNFYPSKINYPHLVKWISSNKKNQIDGLKKGSTNFCIPNQKFGYRDHVELLSSKKISYFDANNTFSFFLSINPNSKIFNQLSNRLKFMSFLKKMKLSFEKNSPIWTRAEQLYSGTGSDRIPEDYCVKMWEKIRFHRNFKATNKIKILMGKNFIYGREILKYFKEHSISYEVIYYKSFFEYHERLNQMQFDVIQANNDFSSVDLMESILVSFRKTRPLIFLEIKNRKLRKLISNLKSNNSELRKKNIIKNIGIEIIQTGLVFPLGYCNKYIYAQNNISFDNLSKIFPDPRIYKLEIKK